MAFSTLRNIACGSAVGMAGMLPFNIDDPDKVDKSMKSVREQFAAREPTKETGPERIKRMFTLEYVFEIHLVGAHHSIS